jgi:ribosomal protein L11 methyltransferase
MSTIFAMTKLHHHPICFSTYTLEEALAELEPLSIKNLTTLEDYETKEHLIFGEIESEIDIPHLHFCRKKKVEANIWEQQWAEFAPHFHEGFAHINLFEYGGPNLSFKLIPGAGFGDLSHPTTEMCLRHLCAIQERDCTAIDIGTGSGVLALGAYLLGFETLALEIDPAALDHAKENFALNQAKIPLAITLNELPKKPLILLNMTIGEQEILFKSAPHLLDCKAEWIISGLLQEQVETYLSTYFKGRLCTITESSPWASLHITL